MIYQKYTGEIELKNIGRKNLLLSKDEVINKQQEEIERLHSIIKEVREYIGKRKFEVSDLEEPPFILNVIEIEELLEILDKVEENK